MKKLTKLLVLIIISLSVIIVYKKENNNETAYLVLGDSFSMGINPYGGIGYGYEDYFKDYLDTKGKVTGINSVKISNAEGIGFAVPINIVKPIINKLVNNNRFDEAWLGIYGYDKEAIQYLDSNIEIESGVYVAQIAVDGPAFGLDIKEGDVITKIDDVKINKMNELKKYIYSKSPNDFVTLHIKRNNREFSIDVKLWGKS